MFFLLYKSTDGGVFDDFPKISDHFPKITENFPKLFWRPDECSRTFSENFRKFPKIAEDFYRLPKTFEEDPKMFWCEDIVSFLSICFHSAYLTTDFYNNNKPSII